MIGRGRRPCWATESARLRRTANGVVKRALGYALDWLELKSFRVEARDLGHLRPGLSLDNVADLLEEVEGPLHR